MTVARPFRAVSSDGRGRFREGFTRNPFLAVNLLEAAFHSASIGTALVGLDGTWLRVNQAICEIVGYSEEELLKLTFQDITHPDDVAGDVALVQQLLRGEASHYELEKRYLHKDGRIVWIHLSATLTRTPEGEPWVFLSQIQDITARKRAEMAREAAELALQQSLAEKERLLEELRAAQQESLALREGLLTVCAWTKRIKHDGRWMSMDEFLSDYLHLQLTHGISDEGMKRALEDVAQHAQVGSLAPPAARGSSRV